MFVIEIKETYTCTGRPVYIGIPAGKNHILYYGGLARQDQVAGGRRLYHCGAQNDPAIKGRKRFCGMNRNACPRYV